MSIYNTQLVSSSLNTRERGDPNTIKTEFPSVYFTLRLMTNEIDPSGEKYYPTGVTNLKGGTKNIKVTLEKPLGQDLEHSAFYAKRKGQKITYNAGDIIELWAETDETGLEALYGTARIGTEHKLFDENNQIVGEAYASAWLTHAQEQVNQTQSGSVQDHIPANIWDKYFSNNQGVEPLKGLSVELAWKHYKDHYWTDGNGVLHITKSDLIRVAWITKQREGQPLSRIEESTIKTFNNQKTMNTIKCLCEANIGDSVYSNGNMYSVLEK
ncbi:MAG: hypothetical protein ACRCZ2_05275, partial [Fusobacteriaceae bacterium]